MEFTTIVFSIFVTDKSQTRTWFIDKYGSAYIGQFS